MEFVVTLTEDQPLGRAGMSLVCSDQINPVPGSWVLAVHPEQGPILTDWPTRLPWMATVKHEDGAANVLRHHHQAHAM